MEQQKPDLLSKCPWCDTLDIEKGNDIKDFFFSQEDFSLYTCKACGLVFTNPRPDLVNLGHYYESDNYYSHSSDKRGFLPFIYRKIKERNLKIKFKQVASDIPCGQILDIGCGTGDFLKLCRENGWAINGIEPNANAAKLAVKKLSIPVLEPSGSIELLDNSFDLITMWHVLEHVSDLKLQLHELSRLMKKGGRLVIALPNYESYDAYYYNEFWAAWDVPRHLYHFNRNVIQSIMQSAGFNPSKIYPMKWDAYYVSMLSEKYRKSGLYLIRAFFKGVTSNRKAKVDGNYSSLIYVFTKV